ncbi:MAG: CPBP family intramembrane metalloprotease [Pseudodesulfovibrio sp.]
MTTKTAKKTGLIPIVWFVAITFVATIGIQAMLIRDGIRFDTDIIRHTPTGWLLLTMWIPGLAALFVTKFIEGATFKELVPALSLRVGSLGPYFLTLIIAPLALGAMYGISWALGLTSLDLTMSALTEITGSDEAITPETVFQVMLPMSIVIGPFIHFLFSLGEEIGWRGFLLPRLMVLGKLKAYLILGILWGLWHAPIIWVGFNYPGHPMTGIAMMCMLTSAFGLFINEMTLFYRSTILAAFIHAAVNAQGFGIWIWLFPDVNPLLGGGTGLTAIGIWLLVGGVTIKLLSRRNTDQI